MVSFASAHSRGLRLKTVYLSTTTLYFATAHSRGLRLDVDSACIGGQSLPQRIRAGCDVEGGRFSSSCDASPQRIRAGCDFPMFEMIILPMSLPQRIRAGCDPQPPLPLKPLPHFATAHSCGLRLRKSNAAHCEFAARR